MNKKILIIPDVHGRTFWKSALRSGDYEKIVFLGDYTDPYEMEDITNREALKNFKSIIAFKQQNPEKVVLLLVIMTFITILSIIMNLPVVSGMILFLPFPFSVYSQNIIVVFN